MISIDKILVHDVRYDDFIETDEGWSGTVVGTHWDEERKAQVLDVIDTRPDPAVAERLRRYVG